MTIKELHDRWVKTGRAIIVHKGKLCGYKQDDR